MSNSGDGNDTAGIDTNAGNDAGTGLGDGDSTNTGDSTGSESTANTTDEYTRIAKEKGWKPLAEYDGDPEGWVAAEEFVKRQPLFDKIRTQGKKLKELEKTVEAIAKHFNTSIAQAKQKAIEELKDERREAINLGDHRKVDELDSKIDEVKAMPEVATPAPTLKPEIEQFITDHSDWFNKNKEMTRFAVNYNESYLVDNPGDLNKSLEETLKAVKRAYPDHFANKRRSNPPTVETGGNVEAAAGGGKYSINRLSNEQKLVYNQLVKTHKQMTHDAYFKSLEDAGYLEK